MMRLKVEKLGVGLHPSEVVVEVKTTSGVQQLFIDRDSLDADSSISVGWPVGQDQDGKLLLVELPGETANGSWRVWVGRGDVYEEKALKRASA